MRLPNAYPSGPPTDRFSNEARLDSREIESSELSLDEFVEAVIHDEVRNEIHCPIELGFAVSDRLKKYRRARPDVAAYLRNLDRDDLEGQCQEAIELHELALQHAAGFEDNEDTEGAVIMIEAVPPAPPVPAPMLAPVCLGGRTRNRAKGARPTRTRGSRRRSASRAGPDDDPHELAPPLFGRGLHPASDATRPGRSS